MIEGNIQGLPRSIADRLEQMEKMTVERGEYVSQELLYELADITGKTGKEICVYISRAGDIESLAIGEADRVSLTALTMRRSQDRLAGLRCIHTHPGGNARLSQPDIQSLKKLRLDAMSAVGVADGKPSGISMAVLDVDENGELTVDMHYCADVHEIPHGQWLDCILQADGKIGKGLLFDNEKQTERVVLLGHEEESLKELAALVDTAGGVTAGSFVQKGRDGGFGKGKLHETALYIQAENIDLAVYDDELTAVEQKYMEQELGCPVLDRTALILDIFAMRARTGEGQLQVELAQAYYALSRLVGEGAALSQQGGGIGTRGPGEKKLETDRRHIKRRIGELKSQLAQLGAQRELQRKRRTRNRVPQIALVGYTNAGKSTLLKVLTGAETFAENRLFATLDPLTRSCLLDRGTEVCFTDTVGFIRKLPHQLVEAFRSTLEEAACADLLLHVCDGSSPAMFRQIEAVEEVLEQISAQNLPRITVINKCDAAQSLPELKGAVYISALTGQGLEELKSAITEKLGESNRPCCVTVPYQDGDILAFIHDNAAAVQSQEYAENGTRISFIMPAVALGQLKARMKERGIQADGAV